LTEAAVRRSLLLAASVLLSPAIASAQSAEDFYRGKTVSVIIGYPPAGANDLFIFSTPDTPADRIQALRRAFDAMVKDPEFMADLKTQKLELGPLAGEELQKLVAEVANVSPATIERVRGIYSVN
jgi:hypothetical protein